jgi:hypothetical protein
MAGFQHPVDARPVNAERLGDPLRINHPAARAPRAAAVIFDNIARGRKPLMNLAA